MLCQVCSAIDFRFLEDLLDSHYDDIHDWTNRCFDHLKDRTRAYYFHHRNPSDLLDSARTGCHLCTTLWYGLFHPQAKSPRHLITEYSTVSCRNPIVLKLPYFERQTLRERLLAGAFIWVHCGSYRFMLFREDEPHDRYKKYCLEIEELHHLGSGMAEYFSTGSDLSLRLAQEWYHTCVENDENCRVAEPRLPRRVIDVGSSGDLRNPVMIEPPETANFAEYIALSHCWGGATALEAKVTDTPGLWDLPPLSKWHPTFRDTVKVCRAFGIRYLWIDAPCILQGNEKDFDVESTKMAEYFRNSAFTLAAVAARSSHEGLFRNNNPYLSSLCRIPFQEKSPGACFELYFKPRQDDLYLPAQPLHDRGWVLQEEILSPRILNFGEGISWKCLSNWTSEYGLPQQIHIASKPKPLRANLSVADYRRMHVFNRNPYYEAWYQVIDRLGCRNMTYQDDMLPAISGVAQIFRPCFPEDDIYAAGLWKSDIVRGLLWFVDPASQDRAVLPSSIPNYQRKGSFYAPSWSWVSMAHARVLTKVHDKIIPGGVLNNGMPEDVSRLTDVKITLKNKASPYGLITSGTLGFRARCVRIFISDLLEKGGVGSESIHLEVGRLGHDLPFRRLQLSKEDSKLLSSSSIAYWNELLENSPASAERVTGDCLLDREAEGIFEQLATPADSSQTAAGGVVKQLVQSLFLPLMEHGHDTDDTSRILGLALVPVNGTDTKYKRIGRAAITANEGWLYWEKLPIMEIEIE